MDRASASWSLNLVVTMAPEDSPQVASIALSPLVVPPTGAESETLVVPSIDAGSDTLVVPPTSAESETLVVPPINDQGAGTALPEIVEVHSDSVAPLGVADPASLPALPTDAEGARSFSQPARPEMVLRRGGTRIWLSKALNPGPNSGVIVTQAPCPVVDLLESFVAQTDVAIAEIDVAIAGQDNANGRDRSRSRTPERARCLAAEESTTSQHAESIGY